MFYCMYGVLHTSSGLVCAVHIFIIWFLYLLILLLRGYLLHFLITNDTGHLFISFWGIFLLWIFSSNHLPVFYCVGWLSLGPHWSCLLNMDIVYIYTHTIVVYIWNYKYDIFSPCLDLICEFFCRASFLIFMSVMPLFSFRDSGGFYDPSHSDF